MNGFKGIQELTRKYNELGVELSLDWFKYNNYALVHHSTSIEGSTLSPEETALLLDEDITAKGKPMLHHYMVKDHYNALLYVLEAAEQKATINTDFICKVSAFVMNNTGGQYNQVTGSFDASKGELRLLNVTAGETRFPDFKKVPKLLKVFCNDLNKLLGTIKEPIDIYNAAYDAHFNLVSIHPFADGNGRISRLIMNYVQHRFNIPLTIVHTEDKADYYKSLVDTRAKKDINIFRNFMYRQHKKHLIQEIEKVQNANKKVDDVLRSEHNKNNGQGMSNMFF